MVVDQQYPDDARAPHVRPGPAARGGTCRRRRRPGPSRRPDRDHETGTSIVTVVPAPGAADLDPSADVAGEVVQQPQAHWAGRRHRGRGIEADAVVVHGERSSRPGSRRRPSRRSTADARRARRRCAAPPGPRGTRTAPRCSSAGAWPRRRHRASPSTPRASSPSARSPSAAARPVRRRLGGWMSTTSDRTTDRRAHGVLGRDAAGADSARPGLVRHDRGPCQGDRRGGEVLDDPVVQVRGDPAALGVRRRERAVQHQLALPTRAGRLPGQPHRERELHELQQHQRPDGDRQELQPDRRSARPPSSSGM